ncbi:BTAD domain-containing putative transcriptional regulator (plasmid) [Rhodococcus aetherivorans]|uniref:BTAD domain-containing putative transcriptional regulator n=1 Tax=Rhodococcus aetherivorans TaxID=191292 RepID=UPI0031D255EA
MVSTPQVTIDLLGPLRICVDGTPLPAGGSKQRAVLALLTLHRNRALSVDTLVEAVWEDEPPAEARANLQVIISKLRRVLREAGVDAPAVLDRAGSGYRLTLDDRACDLGRFHTEKTAGFQAAARQRFDEASSHFTRALAQWSGPALDDLHDLRFAATFATALVEEKLTVLTARAEADNARGRAQAIIPELLSLTADHPLREPLWAQLITALYLCGRQSDALDACRRLKTTLADELGLDPSPPLQELEQRILRQEQLPLRHTAVATAARALTVLDERPRTPTARLRTDDGTVYPLGPAGVRIGRLPDNDLVLADSKASRHHASITATGPVFVLRDLHSSNGLYLNGHRITDPTALTHGDVLRIGTTELTFETTNTQGQP